MDYHISKDAWTSIYSKLIDIPYLHTQDESKLRVFIEAIFFMARSGCQWRLLPSMYGHWRAIHRRYKKWAEKKIWEILMNSISEIDDQEYMIDSTGIRAHACSSGYKKDSSDECCLGRSAGGFTTKIHALVDGLGNLVKVVLSPGQSHDSTKAAELIEDIPKGSALLADKGYDSDAILEQMDGKQIKTLIPPKRNRLNPRSYDKHQYKERHLVECFFSKIKHFRRVFSRFDKSIESFLGFIYFVGTLLWLR